MPDLDYRFDKYTEEYQADELDEIRSFARDNDLPDGVGLEIGTNRGRFLTELSQRRPGQTFVGVEWTKKHAETAEKRLNRHDIDNAYVLNADVKHVIPVLFDAGQLEDVFLLYPDPWWKTRHHKRRVIQPDFLDMLAPKMADGSHLWIRTDVGPYADHMAGIIDAHCHFRALPADDYPVDPFPRSTRERHVIRQGLPVHCLYYQKIEPSQ